MAKNVVDLWGREDGRWQRTPIRGERAHIPTSLGDLEPLRVRLEEAGHAPAIVNGITGWLVEKALGRPDTTSDRTRAGYRKILAELEAADNPRSVRYVA